MRVLLSTIGSRGDVAPLVALALRLREDGRHVRLCAPPDFGEWVGELGIPFVPIGPELRSLTASRTPGVSARPAPEDLRRLADGTVATQFTTIPAAARNCDVLVAGGALQIAARSVSEHLGIRYVYAAYCPVTLPSPHHPPLPLPRRTPAPADGTADNRTLWTQDAQHWNDTFGAALNSHRMALGLPPVTDVRGHIFTDRPWLAADPTLGPWPLPADQEVIQPGAWILPDRRPLSADLERFLDAGDPPIYFGLGSMRAGQETGHAMIAAARKLGRRAILSRGWADLSLTDDGADCLSIGEVNQQALFRRVAAVVHHGGAGTTTAAARSGAPQVVLPQMYDQHYWARRVHELGIGTTHPAPTPPAVTAAPVPTADSLAAALDEALRPEIATRARLTADAIRTDGTEIAAQLLTTADSIHAPTAPGERDPVANNQSPPRPRP